MNTLYLFIDESGNFDFTESGTDHFILTILCTLEPEVVQIPLAMIHDDIKNKTNPAIQLSKCGFLHASEDKQILRNEVVAGLNRINGHMRIDSVIARKNNVRHFLRDNHEELYYKMGAAALKFASKRAGWQGYDCISANFGHLFHGKKKRELSDAFTRILQETKIKFSLTFSEPKANLCSQAVDYYGWAIYRKYERGDQRTYDLLKKRIRTEWVIY